MFSPGSKAFQLACTSLYGRSQALNDREVQTVVSTVKARRELVRLFNGDALIELNKAFGFVDEFELMDGDSDE